MQKLSIITINYNNKAGLQKTIESVINQTNKNIDYIVIDGGSTDGSAELIKEYQNCITYWESQPDKGIYHAMNKGVSHSNSDFCLFLNSGDFLFDENVIQNTLPLLNTAFDFITGYTWLIKDNGELEKSILGNPQQVSIFYLLRYSLSHPSTFIKSSLLKSSPYDENLKAISDWKFFLDHYIEYKYKFHHIEESIACFNLDGISSNNIDLLRKERQKVMGSIPFSKVEKEILEIPPELSAAWKSIPNNARLKKLLIRALQMLIRIYKTTR